MREELQVEGLAVWLYRSGRDPMRLTAPLQRIGPDLLRPAPIPFHLYDLIAPVTCRGSGGAPDIERKIMGRVIQALHCQPILRGVDFKNTDLEGSDAEMHAHLET